MFSVVIPAYNAAHTIERCLNGVAVQGELGVEVVVVDDGSTDHTAEVVEVWAGQNSPTEVILVRQENKGLGAARNAGVQASTRPWICFLDADDYWLPGYLAAVKGSILSNPQSTWWSFPVWEQGANWHKMRRHQPIKTIAQLLRVGNPFVPSATTLSKEVALQFPFDTDRRLMGTEDLQLWVELLQAGIEPAFGHEPLVVYQLDAGMSSALEEQEFKVKGRLNVLLKQGRIDATLRTAAFARLNYDLARAYHKQKNFSEALKHYQRGGGPLFKRWLGWLLANLRVVG